MTSAEVLVVGGGPAGCAAATLLARWGHRVTLIAKPADDTLALGESIPPSARKLFDVLGLTNQMDAAGFIRASGNTVWWGSPIPRVESFGAGTFGWQVTTTALQTLLQDAAARSGVSLEQARVDAAAVEARRAAFVLDCSGRAGVFARPRRLRVHEPSRTVALVGLWAIGARFELPDPTHTVIESYDGGWIWSVPHSADQRFVAVMVDPRVSALAREAASRQVYLQEIAKARETSRRLADATLVAGPRGWDASMYGARQTVDGNVLLVGDAASFIDPLSSAGVTKALASGWLAAVATHTSLVQPQLRAVALEFFAAREHEMYAAYRSLTERYWTDAASGHAHPFWNDRAATVEDAPGDAARAEAFTRVRTAPALHVVANPAAAVAPRPAVSGNEIVLEPRLVRDECPAGIRYAYGVDVITLVELAPSFTSVPELYDAYCRRQAPVPLPDLLAALATTIAQHWLQWCDTN